MNNKTKNVDAGNIEFFHFNDIEYTNYIGLKIVISGTDKWMKVLKKEKNNKNFKIRDVVVEIDGIEKEFTIEEFKEKLGFKKKSNEKERIE